MFQMTPLLEVFKCNLKYLVQFPKKLISSIVVLIRGKFSDCVFMTHVEVDGSFFKYFWVSKVDLYIDLYINVVCSCSNFFMSCDS